MPFHKGFHYYALMQSKNYGRWKATYGKFQGVVAVGPMKVAVWTSGLNYNSKEAAEQAAKDKIDSGNLDKFKK